MGLIPFQDIYRGKKVLITGHTGFKGTWLTTWLLQLGADVVGLSDRIPTNPSMFEDLKLADKINHIIGDVRNLEKVTSVIKEEKPDFVFHLAAQAIVSESYEDPITTFSTNMMGTANVLEAIRLSEQAITCTIVTSDKCYDNVEWQWGYRENDALGGKDIYSGSKGGAELVFKSYFHSFFKESNKKIVSTRAGNVIGGGDWAKDRLVPDCYRSWSKGEVVEIRSPNATRPWQHVLEPLSGYLNIAAVVHQNETLNGESYNFGPNPENNHRVIDLLKDLATSWGMNEDKAYNIVSNIQFHEAKLLKLNCDKATLDLKWKATLNYNDTTRFVGEWYEKYFRDNNVDLLEFTQQQINEYVTLAGEQKIPWAYNG